jgi:uncharacterized repeat protein (TIGR03806 family)
MKQFYFLIFLGCTSWMLACSTPPKESLEVEEMRLGELDKSSLGPLWLSEFGFFAEPMKRLEPRPGVVPYTLNSSLFSDYAYKARFIRMPVGTAAQYQSHEVFDFPDSTILIKNFYYPEDFRQPDGARKILETRLLIKTPEKWKALVYVWNEAQTDARLEIIGTTTDIAWTHYDGRQRRLNYSIPNVNQCQTCHENQGKLLPIGTVARQLNGPREGSSENQLEQWYAAGLLQGLPENPGLRPRLVSYHELSDGTLALRARAWLEINCGSCHRPEGSAKNSGLHLMAEVTDPLKLGIGKPPVAAGRGSGGLDFDIVPGKPAESILFYRITSTEPGVMMPEIGRKSIHKEGVALIREWIEGLEVEK